MALLTRFLGMESDDVLTMCADSLKDVRGRKVHTYSYIYHVVGRKPEERKPEENK